ncbi:MAG: hypothetical protein N3B13_09130 [Deltaproteobacteria bacterium]|nr:hypothetical protein [Deltaproteobacteria bacterium]
MEKEKILEIEDKIRLIEEEHRILDAKIKILQGAKYITQRQDEELKALKYEKLKKKKELIKLRGLLGK